MFYLLLVGLSWFSTWSGKVSWCKINLDRFKISRFWQFVFCSRYVFDLVDFNGIFTWKYVFIIFHVFYNQITKKINMMLIFLISYNNSSNICIDLLYLIILFVLWSHLITSADFDSHVHRSLRTFSFSSLRIFWMSWCSLFS